MFRHKNQNYMFKDITEGDVLYQFFMDAIGLFSQGLGSPTGKPPDSIIVLNLSTGAEISTCRFFILQISTIMINAELVMFNSIYMLQPFSGSYRVGGYANASTTICLRYATMSFSTTAFKFGVDNGRDNVGSGSILIFK